MTHGELKDRLLRRCDQDPAAPVNPTAAEATRALNRAQEAFAFLTLCLEKTVAVGLTQNTTWYATLTAIPDAIAVLRVVDSNGTRVRPARLQDLDALDRAWQNARAAAPKRYVSRGGNLLGFYPAPNAAGVSVTVTVAHAPAALVGDNDVPQIPAEHHPLLVEFGEWYLRGLKWGAEELQAALPGLRAFLKGAAKCAAYVRMRSLTLAYDTLPLEIEQADLSRFTTIRKDLLPTRQRKEPAAWTAPE